MYIISLHYGIAYFLGKITPREALNTKITPRETLNTKITPRETLNTKITPRETLNSQTPKISSRRYDITFQRAHRLMAVK